MDQPATNTTTIETGYLVRLNPQPALEPFLKRREVAQLLGCSEATVSLYISSGRLKAFQLGRQWLVPPAAIRELQTA